MSTTQRGLCVAKCDDESANAGRDLTQDGMRQRRRRRVRKSRCIEGQSCCAGKGVLRHWIRRFRETPRPTWADRENVPLFGPPDVELFKTHLSLRSPVNKAWTPTRNTNPTNDVLKSLDVLNLQSDVTLNHCELFLRKSAAYDRLLLRLLNKYPLPSTWQKVERVTNISPAIEQTNLDSVASTVNVSNRIKRLYAKERDEMSRGPSDAFGVPLGPDESGNAAPLHCVKNRHSVTLPTVTLSKTRHTAAAHVSSYLPRTAAIDGFASSAV